MNELQDSTIAEEFYEILGQAIHDAEHEIVGRKRIIHFWDYDSLHLPLVGAAALVGSKHQSQDDRLVQALFSAGFLGQVSLLRPHRAEFIGQIYQLRENSRAREIDHATAYRYVEESDEIAEVRELASILNNGTLSDEDLRSVVQQLRDISSDSFIYLESLAGRWPTRLTRLLSSERVDLSPYGPTLSDLASTEEFDRLGASLASIRNSTRRASTVIDAAALTSLISLNRSAAAGAGSYPRFFTSSAGLRELYRKDHWLREQLSFDIDGTHKNRGTVWRTSQYYLLRAVFPCLRLAGARMVGDGPTLGELQDLHLELGKALALGDASVAGILREEFFKEGSPLATLIDDLQKSRMARVWLSLDGTSIAEQFVSEMANLMRLGQDRTAKGIAEELEESIEQQLDLELDDYRVSIEIAETFSKLARRTQRIRGRKQLSISLDMGAVRWGIEFPRDDPRDQLMVDLDAGTGHMSDVLRSFDVESMRLDAELASRNMCILLGLEKFDLALDLCRQLHAGNQAPAWTDSLSIMSAVARLCSSEPLNGAELDVMVTHLMDEFIQLDVAAKSRLALGYGYAIFRAWSRSSSGGAWTFSGLVEPDGVLDWVTWTIEVVEGQLKSVSELGRLYAVNHLLYASACAGLGIRNRSERLLDLEQIARLYDNPMFLDTVGFAIAKPIWDARSRREGIDSMSTVRADLERAVRHLRRAGELAPDDVEVAAHLHLVERMLNAKSIARE